MAVSMLWFAVAASQDTEWIGRMADWTLREAKTRSSALVDAALVGNPQWVTRRGQPAVVVLAVDDYERLRRIEKAGAPTLRELLLEIPRDGGEFE